MELEYHEQYEMYAAKIQYGTLCLCKAKKKKSSVDIPESIQQQTGKKNQNDIYTQNTDGEEYHLLFYLLITTPQVKNKKKKKPSKAKWR